MEEKDFKERKVSLQECVGDALKNLQLYKKEILKIEGRHQAGMGSDAENELDEKIYD